jgi:hypothetical protein
VKDQVDLQVDNNPSCQKVSDRTSNDVKLVRLQIRLPMLQNNGIKDVLSLFIQKVLVGSKWWEFLEIVVDFVPPGVKLTDLSFT